MATYNNIKKIKIGENTFNLYDSGNSGGTITKVATSAGAHSTISVTSGAASFNVPTKTSHLTNDSGFLTNSTLYEANLNWGGKDFSAGYSPMDASMIDVLGANRFAFLKAAGLTIEYSTNGGTSYTDYGATDSQKVGLFSSGQAFYLGKHTSNGSCTTNDRLRVTIDTGAANIYTNLNKISIYMSTSGATVQVLIEKALQSTPTVFSTHKDWTGISGWSGWNILNISGLTTYGNVADTQYGRVRFTFRQTAVNTTYSSANISKIMGFGGVGWTVPSTMAATGHLYSYDSSQNAVFPAQVTATYFNGPLYGNATSATVSGKISDLGSGDNASSTNTWRKVWFSYEDGVTGRPALIDNLTFQTSTGTLKATTFSGDVTGTATGNLTSVQYDSTNAKLTYTKNGSNTDIVTVATLKTALGSMTPASHTHGNITNGGDITATAPTIASGDQIIINDNSASKITNGPTFDGSTTTTALTPKGTWETFSKFSGNYNDLTNKPTIPTNTDEKLKVAEVSSGGTYYPIVGSGTTAATRQYDTTGLQYAGTTGTTSAIGTSKLTLGNTTASGTAGNKEGILILDGSGTGSAWIHATPNNNGHNWQFYVPLGTGATDTKFNLVAANSYSSAVGSSTKPVYIASGGLVAECNSYPTATGSATTGISIGNHSTGSIYGVQSTTTTASKVTLGTAKSVPNVTSAGSASTWVFEDVTVPIRNDSATSIPNVTSVGSASTWSFSDVTVPIRADSDTTVPTAASSATTVPIKNATATSIPNVTSVGSASTWSFSDVTVPIRNDSATSIPNVTAVGSGSFTQGSFSGGSGSFTQGSFSGGSGSFSASVTNHVLSFSHTHTAATHGADSHTHTAATHGADSHTHTAPTLGTAISIYGVKSGTNSTTTASKASGANGTAPTLGTAISIYGVQSTTTSVTGVSGSTSVRGVKTGTSSTTTASKASGANGSAPTLGTAISIYGVKSGTSSTVTASHVKSGGNGTAPTLGTAISIPNVTGVTDVTVPIKNSSATTVVTSATHSVTDNGHTHSI